MESKYGVTGDPLFTGHVTQPNFRPKSQPLHWVLVQRLIVVRAAILVWECIHDVTPVSLHESCVPVRNVHGRPWSRSASTGSTWQEYKHQSDRHRRPSVHRSRDPAKFQTKIAHKGLNIKDFTSKHPLFEQIRLWKLNACI